MAPPSSETATRPVRARLFAVADPRERARLAEVLRKETVGGMLLVGAAIVALIWANSPWGDSYASLRDTHIGPESLHLNLSLEAWAADGLLAIFFFVAGLELRREFVAGELWDVRRAALPVVAAIGGVLLPAAVFALVNAVAADGDLGGWAIPAATDIAFALAVLVIARQRAHRLGQRARPYRCSDAARPTYGRRRC